MFERFTDSARRVVVLAQEEARELRHDSIGSEHLLLGLLAAPNDPTAEVLAAHGVSADAVRDEVVRIDGRGRRPPDGHMPYTPRMKKVLELSLRASLELGHEVVDTEHLLLGLIREGQGPAVQVLVGLGCDLDELRRAAVAAVPAGQLRQQLWRDALDENDHLRAEVARLRQLLVQHGIDPDHAA